MFKVIIYRLNELEIEYGRF